MLTQQQQKNDEFHNTKRIAIINKDEWINTIWTNGEIYSGNIFTGQVDLDTEGNKTWYPKRYKTKNRDGVELIKIRHLKELEKANTGLIYFDEMYKCLP